MVREGYKQTEVGVIPEDWEVLTLSEMCLKIQDGTHFSPSLGGADYLYITSKNIGRGFLKLDNAERIDKSEHRKIYGRCDVRKGDLLLTKDGVNTGNAALNTLEEEFSLLSSVAFLRFDSNKYDANHFLQQILSSDGQNRMKDLMSGNAITRLTLEKINKIIFPVPPLPEQRAIATALSDVDALIAALDKLIAKQRHLKTATMQQLLTGKKRLPGFGEGKSYKQTEVGVIPEDWDCNNLLNLVEIAHGFGFQSQYFSSQGLYRLTTPGNFYEEGGFRDMEEKQKYYIGSLPNGYLLEGGDLIVAMTEQADGLLGSAAIIPISGQYLHNQRIGKIKPKSFEVESNFLYYIFNSNRFRQKVQETAAGTKVKHTSPKKLLEIDVLLPPFEEQRAIATVLSDMDAAISALETRRAKTQAIKQGMMQELLTGRTRLV